MTKYYTFTFWELRILFTLQILQLKASVRNRIGDKYYVNLIRLLQESTPNQNLTTCLSSMCSWNYRWMNNHTVKVICIQSLHDTLACPQKSSCRKKSLCHYQIHIQLFSRRTKKHIYTSSLQSISQISSVIPSNDLSTN